MRIALVLAITMAATAARSAEPAPPFSLLAELKSLCVDTKAEPKAIAEAARARHYRDVRANQFGLGGRWETVNVVIEQSSVMQLDDLGTIQSHGCMILVRPGSETDIQDVLRLASPWALTGEATLQLHGLRIRFGGASGGQWQHHSAAGPRYEETDRAICIHHPKVGRRE